MFNRCTGIFALLKSSVCYVKTFCTSGGKSTLFFKGCEKMSQCTQTFSTAGNVNVMYTSAGNVRKCSFAELRAFEATCFVFRTFHPQSLCFQVILSPHSGSVTILYLHLSISSSKCLFFLPIGPSFAMFLPLCLASFPEHQRS